MATEKLFYKNPYQTETRQLVLSCEAASTGWAVETRQTIFYPTGGGQPHDCGRLGEAQVLDVQEEGERIVHYCDRPLPVGQTVLAQLDWKHRFSLMQQHSGEHLVSGLIHNRFGYDNVGFHMGSDGMTIDFSGELTQQEVTEIEVAANETIWKNLPINAFYPDAHTLQALSYRSKKALSGQVRLVQVADIDLCACCGLHVTATGEIGPVKLLSVAKFHAGSRVELLCGGQAMTYLNAVFEQNRQISAMLSAKPFATAAAAQRVSEECSAAQYRTVALENQLFTLKAQAMRGVKDPLLFEADLTSDALRRLTDIVLQHCAGVCAVFSGSDGNYKYAIGQQNGDIRELVRAMNAALNGRGGGKPGFAQGSVKASHSEIASFFSMQNR